jgi:hypothetical protein
MRTIALHLAGIATLAVAVGCAAPAPERRPVSWGFAASNDLVYAPLGLRLGPRFEDLERVSLIPIQPGDPDSQMGVAYRQASEKISLTFYIYPREAEQGEAHFKANLARIQADHADATVELAGPTPTELAGKTVLGYLALILYEERKQPVASLLRVIPASDYFIKLRVTIPFDAGSAPSREQSVQRIGDLSKRFLASLPLAVQ